MGYLHACRNINYYNNPTLTLPLSHKVSNNYPSWTSAKVPVTSTNLPSPTTTAPLTLYTIHVRIPGN